MAVPYKGLYISLQRRSGVEYVPRCKTAIQKPRKNLGLQLCRSKILKYLVFERFLTFFTFTTTTVSWKNLIFKACVSAKEM